MDRMNSVQFVESIVGGRDESEINNSKDPDFATKRMVGVFLYGGGGSGDYSDNPVDKALEKRAQQRKRDDPEGYEKWQRKVREQYKDIIQDRETEEWLRKGKPLKPVNLTPTPETTRDKHVREEMAKEGYVPVGRDPKTGGIKFKKASEGEPPWFLSILGGGYEMAGTVMHALPYSSGAVGLAQRLERDVGSLVIGEVRDGNPELTDLHHKLENVSGLKLGGIETLEVMGNVPVLNDIAYALWTGHMHGLSAFQRNLAEDGIGTALLDNLISKHEQGTLGSEDDYVDVLVTLLSTAPPESHFGATLSLKTSNVRGLICSSIEQRGIKIPRELKDALDFLGLDAGSFEDSPHIKLSGVPDRMLDGFSDLIAQTTYSRLVEKLTAD